MSFGRGWVNLYDMHKTCFDLIARRLIQLESELKIA